MKLDKILFLLMVTLLFACNQSPKESQATPSETPAAPAGESEQANAQKKNIIF